MVFFVESFTVIVSGLVRMLGSSLAVRRLEMKICEQVSTPANEGPTGGGDVVAIAWTRGEADTFDGHMISSNQMM